MTRLASQGFILGLTAGFGALFLVTRDDPAQELYLSIGAVGLILLSLMMERMRPLHKHWNAGQGDTGGDVASFVMIFALLDGALKWLLPFALLAVLPEPGMIAWPLWTQVIVVTLLIELGAWASHWAHHRYAPLWALHAMHHSPIRLYTLNNFRFHPLNHVLNHLMLYLPVLALGFSSEALVAYAALSLPVLIFQHSNLGFDFGALNGVLNTNELHRWHHSADAHEGMTNMGRALIVWDRVFGTYHNPVAGGEPRALGLFAASARGYPAPRRFLAQIAWPFSRRCCS
jgi:sterol desaturase/sphingolipid hydroxylase (fatty acid hydroxylase superfamily)